MGAATVNIPAIALSVGPMLNGWHKGERTGSGTIVWKARQMMAAGEIDYAQFIELVASSAPSTGYCNTMGTATTMNSLAEALGMQLPGSAAIPAPYRDRAGNGLPHRQAHRRHGARGPQALRHPDQGQFHQRHRRQFGDRRLDQCADPHPGHRRAISASSSSCKDWQTHGHKVPLLVNLQPAGEYLGEDYYHAGGVPAVVNELMSAGPDPRERPDRQRQDHRRELPQHDDPGRQGHPPLRQSAEDGCRLPRAARQPVRQRHHEDQRDLAGIPRPLPQRSGASRHVRGQGRGVRRAGGLPPPDRRSVARDRRAHAAVHARRRPDRLSGRGRSGQHAAARLPDQEGHHCARLHRRRPPVGHLGLALDPQRLAGSGGGRQPRHPQDRRPGAHRPQQGRGQHPDLGRGNRDSAAPISHRWAATSIPRTRRRGRKSSAASSTSSATARC